MAYPDAGRYQDISTPEKPWTLRDTAFPEDHPSGKVTLDENRFKSVFDKDHIKANPWQASQDMYTGGESPSEGMASRLGTGIRDFFTKGTGRRVADMGPVPAALIGAGALAIPAMGLGAVQDAMDPDPYNERKRWKRNGILGALLGAGAMGTLGWMRSKSGTEKKAFVMGTSAKGRLMSAVNSDPTIGPMAKARLHEAILGMQEMDAARIFNMLPAIAGAGIGALIARYLLGAGGFGTAAGAAAGAFAGNALVPQVTRPRPAYIMGAFLP
jgi:hypothetical protein